MSADACSTEQHSLRRSCKRSLLGCHPVGSQCTSEQTNVACYCEKSPCPDPQGTLHSSSRMFRTCRAHSNCQCSLCDWNTQRGRHWIAVQCTVGQVRQVKHGSKRPHHGTLVGASRFVVPKCTAVALFDLTSLTAQVHAPGVSTALLFVGVGFGRGFGAVATNRPHKLSTEARSTALIVAVRVVETLDGAVGDVEHRQSSATPS